LVLASGCKVKAGRFSKSVGAITSFAEVLKVTTAAFLSAKPLRCAGTML
jgi:hypothetical protein